MKLADLISTLIFISPGFIATEIYRHRYLRKTSSDSTRLSLSIVASVCIFLVARLLSPHLGFEIRPPPADGSTFPESKEVILLLVLGLLLAGALCTVHWVRQKLASHYECLSHLIPDTDTVWRMINDEEPAVWVKVYFSDGSGYHGFTQKWSWNQTSATDADHDVLLAKASRFDSSGKRIYDVKGRGVYIRSSSIDRVEYLTTVREAGFPWETDAVTASAQDVPDNSPDND